MTTSEYETQVGGGGYKDVLSGYKGDDDSTNAAWTKDEDLAFDLASFAFLYHVIAYDHMQLNTTDKKGGGFFNKTPEEEKLNAYVKLMEKPIKMVGEFAKNLFIAKKTMFQKLFKKSEDTEIKEITVIVPDWTNRHSKVVFRFTDKAKKVSTVNYTTEVLLTHITERVLANTFNNNAADDGDGETGVSNGATDANASAETPNGAEEINPSGGGLFDSLDKYEKLVLAANAAKKLDVDSVLSANETIALNVFTVFYMLFTRGVDNFRADAKYMQKVFEGIHTATGCMAFTSAVYNELQRDMNTAEQYANENRFFVVEAPVGTLIKDDKFRSDFKKDRFKQVALETAFSNARTWIRN